MSNFGKMMKQAQQMQEQMLEMQNKLQDFSIEGSSGGSMVRVTLNGKSDILKIWIDQKLMSPEDNDVVADLIVAAFHDAKEKIETKLSAEMSAIASQMGLPPGMKLPF